LGTACEQKLHFSKKISNKPHGNIYVCFTEAATSADMCSVPAVREVLVLTDEFVPGF